MLLPPHRVKLYNRSEPGHPWNAHGEYDQPTSSNVLRREDWDSTSSPESSFIKERSCRAWIGYNYGFEHPPELEFEINTQMEFRGYRSFTPSYGPVKHEIGVMRETHRELHSFVNDKLLHVCTQKGALAILRTRYVSVDHEEVTFLIFFDSHVCQIDVGMNTFDEKNAKSSFNFRNYIHVYKSGYRTYKDTAAAAAVDSPEKCWKWVARTLTMKDEDIGFKRFSNRDEKTFISYWDVLWGNEDVVAEATDVHFKEKMAHFALAFHDRLGKHSGANKLKGDNIRDVFNAYAYGLNKIKPSDARTIFLHIKRMQDEKQSSSHVAALKTTMCQRCGKFFE